MADEAGAGIAALLDGLAEPFAVEAGHLLFRQGDPATGIWFVHEGRLGIAARTPGDDALQLSEVDPGGFVGELATIDGGRRAATATALTAVAGRFLSSLRFAALQSGVDANGTALLDHIRQTLARRIRATLAAIAGASQTPILRSAGSAPAPAAEGDPAAMLRGLRHFAALSQAEAEALVALGVVRAVAKGQALAGEGVALVLRGAVRAGFAAPGGIDQLWVHGPGDFAGLVAAVDCGVQPLALVACEAALLLELETRRDERTDLSHKLFAAIDRQLVRDLRRANRHLGRVTGIARFNAGENG